MNNKCIIYFKSIILLLILKVFTIFVCFLASVIWSFFLFDQPFLLRRPATLKKETPTQMFSCKYRKIFKSTYSEEHLQTAVYYS